MGVDPDDPDRTISLLGEADVGAGGRVRLQYAKFQNGASTTRSLVMYNIKGMSMTGISGCWVLTVISIDGAHRNVGIQV